MVVLAVHKNGSLKIENAHRNAVLVNSRITLMVNVMLAMTLLVLHVPD